MLVIPVFSFAQTGLVPCGKTDQPACDFTSFMTLINTVINFILFTVIFN